MTDPGLGSDPDLLPRSSGGRWGRGARQVLLGAVVTAIAVLLGAALPLAPLLAADYALDGIVRAVALDVRDFGVDKGRERLSYELAAQGLEGRVGPEQCRVEQQVDGIEVACAWEVVLEVPLVERRVPLPFRSEARVSSSGDLR